MVEISALTARVNANLCIANMLMSLLVMAGRIMLLIVLKLLMQHVLRQRLHVVPLPRLLLVRPLASR